MEVTILFVAVAALILLAVASMRFGTDSREGFASKERELAAHGIVWDGSSATRVRLSRSVPNPAEPKECVPTPCGV